ncbi:putative mannosyl-glycoprotein endo-beta-N-acetylglucosaminidase [Helianthus annuus]|uniref:mannosyl-glycoprotein endo-beta-N-acetylglucosaminidase n=1 Tax=Helianthus annuus TaxID=4232 RepID=A0A251RQI9_HELAN|nr:cytosolic endo-beta-N-acetylglucosaminidase 1 [Helianthus annuus]KAF5771035.1 putative mannosyl-glycoprotein endo-beta-N-acetylglucosaminidase [Helianthus annuus]KAJ0465894.1 putative mannosyl-glycoprotein endo-beta-N-acetylglucosaminidase [Helianthus annuus]KAJ0487471.1 putative mannosyl-glycoprotein endo-beta-N-acetylglucosaminidase [Helianthus annuus]KAJ0661593.1 putative mannosyl-glycoprotein endo-beta-N-acetylglucosaminidase [Helianthus annuus]KAJ0823800.1 putative mannosyl-glycoprotei
MFNSLVRTYINRQTLISIRNLYTSILSSFSPNMSTDDAPQPVFDPTTPSTPVSYPIKTLEELKQRTYFNSFHFQFNKASVPLSCNGVDGVMLPNRRRMMVCHDMSGGYTDDKWIQGGSNGDSYAIWHWYLIDVFIYFSHTLVTLPPPCWVNAAHKHGVKVLGTFIVEWDEGRAIAEQFLATTADAKMYAERLAELADKLGFDGWLINMEVTLNVEKIPILKEFVDHLTKTMHSAVPGSLIIWYDSVTTDGQLNWQNQLNDSNKPFFDVSDGIFLNYSWQEDYPSLSAAVAGNRKFDVYMGIDIFGRGSYGGGQWTTNVALDVIKKNDVSAAMFAPGWIYETQQPPDFQTAQNRWWDLVEKSWGISQIYPKVLPFYSNFDQGRGYHLSISGNLVSDAPWNNLSNQSFQPYLEFSGDTETKTIQAFVDFKQASYSGGGNITFKGVLEGDAYITKRIFHGEIHSRNSPLRFTFSVKAEGSSVIGLSLEFTNTNDDVEKKTSILLASWGDKLLTMERFSGKFSTVIMPHHVNKLETAPEWIIQESDVTPQESTLTGIYALCYKSDPKSSSSDYHAVLGHISIQDSANNMIFPPASEWHVESQNVNWKTDPQGNKTVSLKILWKLINDAACVFSKYNIYVENETNESAQASKYVGSALVKAYYATELLVPAGVTSLRFIIQACGMNGDLQELVDAPFLRLRVEDL